MAQKIRRPSKLLVELVNLIQLVNLKLINVYYYLFNCMSQAQCMIWLNFSTFLSYCETIRMVSRIVATKLHTLLIHNCIKSFTFFYRKLNKSVSTLARRPKQFVISEFYFMHIVRNTLCLTINIYFIEFPYRTLH